MTDRYEALTVIFDKTIREDDAQAWIDAIKLMKHVVDVKGHVSSNLDMVIATSRVESDFRKKLLDAFWPGEK